MKKNLMKLIAMLLTLVMVLTLFAACGGSEDEPETSDTPDVSDNGEDANPEEIWTMSEEEATMKYFKEYEYGTDYIDLYTAIGDQVTADMVDAVTWSPIAV